MTDTTTSPMVPSAEERLALSYEKGGRYEGPFPTYAALARKRKGTFTLCSIEAIEDAYCDGYAANHAAIANILAQAHAALQTMSEVPATAHDILPDLLTIIEEFARERGIKLT